MTPFWEGDAALSRELARVAELVAEAAPAGSGAVQESVRKLLASPGKMLRPGFLLLASRFGSPPDRDRLLRLAAAIELLHVATLVHDDIIDGAATRRGAVTLSAAHGVRQAVLAGDALFAASFTLAADQPDSSMIRRLPRLVARICEGEIAQTAERGRPSRSIRAYLRRTAAKTALLFALSFEAGAREGGCGELLLAALRRLGWNLGMGFQVIDDLLDLEGVRSATGKPVMSDLAQGIYTLPVVLALRGGDHALERTLALQGGRLAKRSRWTAAGLLRARSLVEAGGGLAAARGWAARYTERAHRELRGLPDGPTRRGLAAAADRLLHRDR